MEEIIDVKAIRKALGLTQEGLARELGVSFTTICRWERGHTKPFPLAVEKLKELRKQLPVITGEFVAPAPSKNPGLAKLFTDQFTQLIEKHPGCRYGEMTIDEELPDGTVRGSYWISENPKEQ